MRIKSILLLNISLIILVFIIITGQNLEAMTYDFKVDIFQISGNLPIFAFDNFDDNTLG